MNSMNKQIPRKGQEYCWSKSPIIGFVVCRLQWKRLIFNHTSSGYNPKSLRKHCCNILGPGCRYNVDVDQWSTATRVIQSVRPKMSSIPRTWVVRSPALSVPTECVFEHQDYEQQMQLKYNSMMKLANPVLIKLKIFLLRYWRNVKVQ